MTSEIRTILADEAAMVRSTIAQLLALEPDIAVLGEYDTPPDTLRAVRRFRPDVVVLSAALPGMDGIDAATVLAEAGTRVLLVCRLTDPQPCTRRYAAGYVATTAPAQRLVDAVRAVAGGARFVDPDLADGPATATGELTERERRVLRAVSDGGSTREICASVGLSEVSVGLTLNSLLAKTGGLNRTEALAIASSRGWL